MKADAPSLLFVRMRLTQRWYQRGARNTPLIKAGSNTGQPAAATQAMHPLPPRFKNERVIDGPVSQITTPCLTLTAMAGPWPGIAVGFSVSQASTASPCIKVKVKVKVGKSLHRLNFPVLTSSFRPLFDLPDAPSAVPPTSSEWVPGRPVPKPWRF